MFSASTAVAPSAGQRRLADGRSPYPIPIPKKESLMPTPSIVRWYVLAGRALLTIGLVAAFIVARPALAQGQALDPERFAAAIHEGTCDELSEEAVVELSEFVLYEGALPILSDTPEMSETAEFPGTPGAEEVTGTPSSDEPLMIASETRVDRAVEDLIGQTPLLVVALIDQDQDAAATGCAALEGPLPEIDGETGGNPVPNAPIYSVSVLPTNGADWTGFVWIESPEDGVSLVWVVLVSAQAPEAGNGTPAADNE
jgi:hypothetical protein